MFKPVTVAEVLKTKGFADGKVVAGELGLGHEVKTVTTAELPDAMDWIREGDLVITAAYYMKETPSMQDQWVRGIQANGAAALAIKPSRFIGKIPDSVLQIGNELSFPIIELPPWPTFALLIESATALILGRQAAILKDSEQIHHRLTALFLESKGLKTIAKTISGLLEKSVIIEDKWLNSLATAILKQDAAEAAAPLHGIYPADNSQLKKPQRHFVLDNPATARQRVVFPIAVKNDLLGYLSVLSGLDNLSERDLRVVEHGSTVISLELTKQKAVIEAQERTRLDFLQMICNYNDGDEEEFRRRASLVEFSIDGPITAVVVKRDETKGTGGGLAGCGMERISEMLCAGLKRIDPQGLVVLRHDDIVAFLHGAKNDTTPEYTIACRVKQNIADVQAKYDQIKVHVGIGNAYEKIRDFKRSYEEAQLTAKAGKMFNIDSPVTFDNLGYYRLISSIRDKQELEQYYKDELGKLINFDQKKNHDLIRTLEVYLEYNGNRKEVARKLYLHVNTINYRLAKIEDLLGVDLNQVKVRVSLYLALILYRCSFD